MDRAKYLQLRKHFSFRVLHSALLIYIAQNIILVMGIGFLWQFFSDSPVKFLCVPLIAALMFRSFAMMHEAVHGCASRHRALNDIVGIFTGIFCLLPFQPWRESHMQHHLWSGNVDKDAVVKLIDVFPKLPAGFQAFLNRSWKMWLPILGILQHVVFWTLSMKIVSKKIGLNKNMVSVLAPIIGWSAFIHYLPTPFLLFAVIPTAVLFVLSEEVINLPHHLELPQLRGETRLPVWEQNKVARTCLYPTWFSRFYVLNFNYHTEHHMFPDAPWYYLEQIHQRLQQEKGESFHFDPKLKWILSNRRKTLNQVLADPEARHFEKKSA